MIVGISLDTDQLNKSYDLVVHNLDILNHIQFYLTVDPLDLQKNEILKFQKDFKNTTLTYSLHSYGYINLCEPIEKVRRSWVNIAYETLDLAKDTSSIFVNYHMGYSVSESISRQLLLEKLCTSLKEISRYAQKFSINVNIENDFDTLEVKIIGSSLTDVDTIINCVYSNIKMCYDVGHANIAFSTPFEYKKYIDYIQSFHIHNNEGKIDTHNPFGENGSINLEDIVVDLMSNNNAFFILENSINSYTNALRNLKLFLTFR